MTSRRDLRLRSPRTIVRAGLAAVLGSLLAAPAPRALADGFLEQVGDAIRDGHLELAMTLRPGTLPLQKGWDLVVTRSDKALLQADAVDGKISHLTFRVPDGAVVVVGKGLRPDVVLQEFAADGTGTITTARFHGRGLGRPVIAVFGGLGRSALRKMKLNREVGLLVRGQLLAKPSPPPAPAAAAPGPAPPAGPSFLDLLEEARLDGTTLAAFGGRAFGMGDQLTFETAADTAGATDGARPLTITFEEAWLRPRRPSEGYDYGMKGTLDARFAHGKVVLAEDALSFSGGVVRHGRFDVRSAGTATPEVTIAAQRFDLSLDGGHFHLPGGLRIAVDAGSTIGIDDLDFGTDRPLSGALDLDLKGKTGTMPVKDGKIEFTDATVHAAKLKLDRNLASGVLDLDFDYRLLQTMVVRYPVEGMAPRTVPLEFRGPFTGHLKLVGIGPSAGSLEGTYSFKVPWPPVEKAAFEALRARWAQDLTPALKKVDFTIEPVRFGVCGPDCFVMNLKVTAEKSASKKSRLFRQICVPEGTAHLVVNRETRSFGLKDVKIQPKCDGLVGKLLNFLAPFFTKSYENIELFRLPPDLPFAIDAVTTGADWIRIDGSIDWESAGAK